MRYIAAYLLLALGGKKTPTAAEIKAVLAAAGIEADDARIATLIKELEGKDLDKLVTEGNGLLAKFGGGGGGGPAPGPVPTPAKEGGGKPAEAAKPAVEEAKEESGA